MNVLGRAVPESNNKLPEIVSQRFRITPKVNSSISSCYAMRFLFAQVFATYEMMFACLVPAIVLGAACERSRVVPAMIFVFCWVSCWFPS
jgi:Amt family ammonium transporter